MNDRLSALTQPELRREVQPVHRSIHFITTKALRRAWLWGLASAAYAVPAVVWPHDLETDLPFEALLSFAITMMLGIRVRSAYERWWEGRTQWGKLVNTSRNLAIKLREFCDLDATERAELHRLIQGFARALKNHLRGSADLSRVRGFESEVARPRHVPSHVAARIYHMINVLFRQGRLSEAGLMTVDGDARILLDVCGAAERIKNTPMLPSFPAFLRFSIVVLLAIIPWRVAGDLGWWTLPSMVLATFLTFGGEAVAQAADHPFGTESDDLDLETYCAAIDRTTAELLDVPSLMH